MKPATNTSTADDPKATAAAYMLSALKRAANETLKFVEAQTCLTVMEAYKVWTEADQQNEQLERAAKIIELVKELNQHNEERMVELRALSTATKPVARKATSQSR